MWLHSTADVAKKTRPIMFGGLMILMSHMNFGVQIGDAQNLPFASQWQILWKNCGCPSFALEKISHRVFSKAVRDEVSTDFSTGDQLTHW
jgi:hypothetical protein